MKNEYYILRNSKNGLKSISEYNTYEEAYEALTMDGWELNNCDTIVKVTMKEEIMPIKCPYEDELNKILDICIDDIEMSNRLYKALYKNGIRYIGDIYHISYEGTKKLKGIGKKTFNEELLIMMLKLGLVGDFNKYGVYVWHYNKKLANQWLENRIKKGMVKGQ